MTKPIISIIMPVYNAADFIQESLRSLFSQYEVGVEVVLVDDGSQDNTVALVHESFQHEIDAQILMVYSQENHGVSAARNTGIDIANGKYIGFMDADDLLLPHYIKSVLDACTHNTDIVEFGFKRFIDFASAVTKQNAEYSNNQFGRHAVSSVIDHVYSTARWYPWTRFFKVDLFDGVRFPKGVSFCEDLMTIPYLYEKAQTILVLKEALYGYRVNANSATYQIKNGYIENLVSFYKAIPKTSLIRHQYLKVSTAFAILSCQTKASDNWTLPKDIQDDLFKLRSVWPIYFNVEPRKVMVLLFPNLYTSLKDIFRLIKRKPL